MTQPFSYRKSLLANKSREARLRLDGDKKRARFHAVKRRLYLKQRGLCCFCERKTYLDADHSPNKLLATLEHVIPKSKGGKNHSENLKISCLDCNNKRGTRNFDFFANVAKNKINSHFGILAKTGPKADARSRRDFKMLSSAYWILDGGVPTQLSNKTGKTSKKAKSHKERYNLYAFTSAMNAMTETYARMGLTLSNIPIM